MRYWWHLLEQFVFMMAALLLLRDVLEIGLHPEALVEAGRRLHGMYVAIFLYVLYVGYGLAVVFRLLLHRKTVRPLHVWGIGGSYLALRLAMLAASALSGCRCTPWRIIVSESHFGQAFSWTMATMAGCLFVHFIISWDHWQARQRMETPGCE